MRNKKFFILSFLLTVAFLIYCFYPVLSYDMRYSQHVNHAPSESLAPGRILLTDRNGEVITDKMYPNGYYKAMKTDIDSDFVQALLEIEDKNFYAHWGINIPSKLRALRDNFAGRRVSGGSTITEQYVKNKYFKNAQRSYLQKAREAVLAVYFTSYSPFGKGSPGNGVEGEGGFQKQKDHILNIYYHDAYFGNHLYGIGAAVEVYFEKEKLEDLTQEEIVILLSLLHNPGTTSLEETYFREYFKQVKQRLGYDFERTYFGKLARKENIDKLPFVTKKWIDGDMTRAQIPLIELSDWEQPTFNMKQISSFTRTSIDARLQKFSREILRETLDELSDKNVTNGAIFAMNPKTGETLIYQGSKDFHASDIDGQVDVITSLRQPGSTMKPFLYLMALESGANPDDFVLDIESEYNSFQQGSVYISENYSLKEYGLVRFKKALGNSFNNATVRLAKELGLSEVYDFYKQYGFNLQYSPEHYGYSLVLGNPSITLEQLVYSYSKLLELDNKDKFLLYDILSDPDNRDVSFGVNSILNTSIPQAVKTGTSSDFRDNLVLSYHPDLVVGVWIGNNDNSSMQGVTGITGAGYVWHQVIGKAIQLGYISDVQIPVPEGIEQSSYCLDSPCFRKENIYMKEGKKYFSRPAQSIFKQEDLFEDLSKYELSRLEDLGIQLK